MSERQLFVPGRLCLFGEHADWAGEYRQHNPNLTPGYCLAVGTTQGIYASIARNADQLQVEAQLVDGQAPGSFSSPMAAESLREAARSGSFYAYCAGTAAYIAERYRVGDVTIRTTTMDLPIKKGLSSSAAICVLTARAFNQLYQLGLTVREEMECAYQGELLTGSRCGRMDQVCAYGQTPVFLTFDGHRMEVEPLAPRAPLYLVIVDLQRTKDTRKILHELNRAFGENHTAVGEGVRDALGPQNARILTQARTALEAGNAQLVGELMSEAQAIFDRQIAPACPSELSAPKLHEVLRDPRVQALSWGGKGVGSQGDGCAQLVARDAEAQQTLIQQLGRWLDVNGLALNITARETARARVSA